MFYSRKKQVCSVYIYMYIYVYIYLYMYISIHEVYMHTCIYNIHIYQASIKLISKADISLQLLDILQILDACIHNIYILSYTNHIHIISYNNHIHILSYTNHVISYTNHVISYMHTCHSICIQ
jgi:hypothetical protein